MLWFFSGYHTIIFKYSIGGGLGVKSVTLLRLGKELSRIDKVLAVFVSRGLRRICDQIRSLGRYCTYSFAFAIRAVLMSSVLAFALALAPLDASAGEILETRDGLSIGHGISFLHREKCFVITAAHVVKKTRFYFRTNPSGELRQAKVIHRYQRTDLLLGEFGSSEGCSDRSWSDLRSSVDALKGFDHDTFIDLGLFAVEGARTHTRRKIHRKGRDFIQLTPPPLGSKTADYQGMSGAGAFSSQSNTVIGIIVELPACDGFLEIDRDKGPTKRNDLCPQMDKSAPGPILLPMNIVVYMLEPYMQAIAKQKKNPTFGSDNASQLPKTVRQPTNDNQSRATLDKAFLAQRERERIFNRCDGFAANPADIMRAEGVRGVYHHEIDTLPAIAACRRARDLAIRFAPEETRFQYQYGRALQAHYLWRKGEGNEADALSVTPNQIFEELKQAFDEGHWHAVINLVAALDTLPHCMGHRRARCQAENLNRYREAVDAGASYLLVDYRRYINDLRAENSAVCAGKRTCTSALHDELIQRFDAGDAWAGIALAIDLSWSPESSGCIREDGDEKGCYQQAQSIVTAIAEQGSEDVHSEAAAIAAWIRVDHAEDQGICPTSISVDACRAAAVNKMEELRGDDRLPAYAVQNLAHLYKDEDKATACGSREDCYWKAFKAFEAAAADGDDNARQNLAWMRIYRQTKRICPNGAVACRRQGIALLKDWNARQLLHPWALRTLAYETKEHPDDADCGDRGACNVFAFDAFSEAAENGDENAANYVPWMRIQRPETTYCPKGQSDCRQIAKKELEELRVEKRIQDWGISTLADLHRDYSQEMDCGDRDACRNKAYDLYVEAAASGYQYAQHEIYRHRLFRATGHICPKGPDTCRRETVEELEVLRTKDELADWPLSLLAETYDNERHRDDIEGDPLCKGHEECLMKALPIYEEAAKKENQFAQRQFWRHQINSENLGSICPIRSVCRRKALDEMLGLAELGELHDDHLNLLVHSVLNFPEEAACYSATRCARLLRRLLDARLVDGNHTAAKLVLNSLINDPEEYLSERLVSCAAASTDNPHALKIHWRPCLEELKPLIVSVAQAGELDTLYLVNDFSSALEVDFAMFLNQEEMVYVRNLAHKVWNAVLEAEIPIHERYKLELLAIASTVSPHTCRNQPRSCEGHLRRLGRELAERAVPYDQEGAVSLANHYVGEPGSQLTRLEALAFSEPLQRSGRARGDYSFYLAELRERVDDQECYDNLRCLDELIGLAGSVLNSNDGSQLAEAADSLAEGALKIGKKQPEVVFHLRERARGLGHFPSLTLHLKNRIYENNFYINGRIDLGTEDGRAIIRDLRTLLQRLSEGTEGFMGSVTKEVLLMGAFISLDSRMPTFKPEVALEGFAAHDLFECFEQYCDPPLTNQFARKWAPIHVELLQKRIGAGVDGKWGDKSDKAYRAYLQTLCPDEEVFGECLRNRVRVVADALENALGDDH